MADDSGGMEGMAAVITGRRAGMVAPVITGARAGMAAVVISGMAADADMDIRGIRGTIGADRPR